MIIFYQKSDGKIIGTIDGRIHGQEHAKMWIGDRNETERLVIQWVAGKEKEVEIEHDVEIGKEIDSQGFFKPITKKVKEKIKTKEFEPATTDIEQKEITVEIDKNSSLVYNYYIDLATKKLKRIEKA